MSATDEALLTEARTRHAFAIENEREDRERAKKCLMFAAGQQWEADKITAQSQIDRGKAGRPALTVNKLANTIAQVCNQQRQARPQVKVSPVTDATDDDAEIFQGMIRHIDYASGADVAYDGAFKGAATCGRGFYGISTRYVDDDSFEQEIVVSRIPDPLSVVIDPGSVEIDGSDMRWAMVTSRLTRDEFQLRYPDAEAVSANFYDGATNPAPDWISGGFIMIAEYWRVETEKKTIKKGHLERVTENRKVVQYIVNGVEILDKTEWPGKWIPIIPVWGDELWVEGKRRLFSVISHSLDSQQLLNYYRSIEAESIGLAPRPKWVGYLGQFKTKLMDWVGANKTNVAFLEVDPVTVNGQVAPLPEWRTFDPPVQALTIGAAQASDDIKATSGIFDPSLGTARPDQSGKAIQALQREGDEANAHFMDNLARAMRHDGRIRVDLIPKIYTEAREVRILGADMTQKIVKVNQPYAEEDGTVKHYQLDKGKYDVTVSVGPSYQTQQQEASNDIDTLIEAVPQIFPSIGDLAVKMKNWGPIGDQIADRLKKMLPPQLQDQKEGSQAVPAQVQAQFAAMQQQHAQLVQALNEKTQEIEAKLPEIASKERIAQLQLNSQEKLEVLKIQASIAIAEINASKDRDKARGEQESDLLMQQMSNQHDSAIAAADAGHEAAMQNQQQSFAQQQAEQQAQQAQQQQQTDQQQQASPDGAAA